MATRALVIVDHGSRRPDAHTQLEALGRRVQERAPELLVRIAHMEQAEPSLAQAIEDCVGAGVAEVAVHPLFLAPGRHLVEDIPALVEGARASHPGITIRLLDPVGARDELADLVLATLGPH
jgi:sirohydrochlorin ferrochelatase